MMISKVFKILLFLKLVSSTLFSQNVYEGQIFDKKSDVPIANVELYDLESKSLCTTNKTGSFVFEANQSTIRLIAYKDGYEIARLKLLSSVDSIYFMTPLSIDINEVMILEQDDRFSTTNLNDIVDDVIFAGKKSNKIIIKNSFGNTATNTARHVFNKIGGLNIFQNDDAGLQLNIGGRGLNPGRSANFNIRQNNYDITPDLLGYPESYYTPPTEALKEIQVVRGAASLQYGTQFGGLVNFVFKEPSKEKKLEIITRNTLGSNNLYSNFTSLSGTLNKTSYYSFVNYKNGDGFRANSEYESINLFAHFRHNISKKLSSSFEITYLTYLAQQAGGLTDQMFEDNPLQTNRERNWFEINWLLSNLKFFLELNKSDRLSLNFFALDANRFTVGYRNVRVDQIDPLLDRDLIKGYFKNYGVESRYINYYKFLNTESVFLAGIKYYKSNNSSQQGPGSSGFDADFNFSTNEFPYYPNQSYYNYPNLNTSLFIENIIYLDTNFSITPGARYEFIDTRAEGYYRSITLNLVNDPIFDTTISSSNSNTRNFVLLGVGLSYKTKSENELYGNISQNYRSVTFSDISIQNPSFIIDPDISDESGYSFDIGYRGVYRSKLKFDFNYFGLRYNNRIGFIPKQIEFLPGFFTVKTQKGNIGDAFIQGIETLVDYKLSINRKSKISNYINYAYTVSEYLISGEQNIIGNQVEFVPNHNLKMGIDLLKNKFKCGFQLTYLSDQFTDATNALESNISGTIGRIPSYYVLDFSGAFKLRSLSLLFGVNNLLNNSYFTRRTTGYPGPGIIPSDLRNYYFTLELTF